MVALADLAFLEAGELASLADISRRQNISLPYLEQLFVKLRRGKVGCLRPRSERRLPFGAASP